MNRTNTLESNQVVSPSRNGSPQVAVVSVRVGLLADAWQLQKAQAKIDYFATSSPALLPFDDDLQYRQVTTALFLQAQAQLGLRKIEKAKLLLQTLLERDPHHAPAADLLAGLTVRPIQPTR